MSALLVSLAWRDLWYDRFFLFCNVAVLIGVLVPLMVLYGTKNGITSALLADLANSPRALQIDTLGNRSFTTEQIAPVSGWPGVAFMAPRPRSAFDDVYVRRHGATRLSRATVLPSGLGDPNLPAGLDLGPAQAALSVQVAARLGASVGDEVQLTGNFEAGEREGNILIPVEVVTIVPSERIAGSAVLVPFDIVDAFEALYEGYTVERYGLSLGVPEANRNLAHEGVRVYAETLADAVALEARLGGHLDVATNGISEAYINQISFSRNLTRMLGITTALAAIGLGAALITRAYADVVRKRLSLASLSMLGLPPHALAMLPILQAGLTAVIGLAAAFPVFSLGAWLVQSAFGGMLPDGGTLVFLRVGEAGALIAAVMALSLLSAFVAARVATRLDPATVLRQSQ